MRKYKGIRYTIKNGKSYAGLKRTEVHAFTAGNEIVYTAYRRRDALALFKSAVDSIR